MAVRSGRRTRGRSGKFLQGLVADLTAAAEHEWKLDRKASDGASERDHLESARRQIANLPGWKGKMVAEIVPEGPPFPEDLDYLWDWFQEHSMGLLQTGMGMPTVSWEGLKAWCELTGVRLEHWEAKAMVTLGTVRANISAEKQAAENKKRPPATK